MVGLTPEQRRILMDKLPDTPNLALGALAFAQFLGDRPISLMVAAAGITGWLALLGWALFLGRGKRI